MTTVIQYLAVAILFVSLGASFNRTKELTVETQQHVEEKATYQQTIQQLTKEISRLTHELESTTTRQQDVTEVITERKDGTRVTKRTVKAKEEVRVKEVTIKEDTKQSDVKTTEQLSTEKKITTVTVTKPVDSGRLGLDVGLGTRVDRELGLGFTIDLSYEVKYRLAPRLGVELDTGGKPKAAMLGVEVRL